MEKIKRAKDKNITAIAETVDLGDMVEKLDEIVDWINEHERARKAKEHE